jgi:uncharacterized protein (DUF1800 family)
MSFDARPLASIDPGWAWAPWKPGPGEWEPDRVVHLYRRAGFGIAWGDLQRALDAGPQPTLDRLLLPSGASAQFEADQGARELAAARAGDVGAYEAWWLRRLRESPDPFGERLTLLWHAHFALGAGAVGDLGLFHQHVQSLRQAAAGNLRNLVRTWLGDPAVFAALGGRANRRARPSLAFGRAWLGALASGPGAASAEDVRNVARAFTGWFVYLGGGLRFIEREHDGGEKRILGRQGGWGRNDLEPILSEYPGTARLLAARVYREFVACTPPPAALIELLAERLRGAGSLREAVATVLRSNLFFSTHAIRQRVKSPVELVVGLTRTLGTLPPGTALVRSIDNLGQRLTEPPTVRGWPDGTDWINSLTAPARVQLCQALVAGGAGYGPVPSLAKTDPAAGAKPADTAAAWRALLLADALEPAAQEALARMASAPTPGADGLRHAVYAIVAQPEFQLG